ncbi:MAG: cupin domain-containing protein [Bacteroidetes bacterium]|nr:cupin domain-containing protein [Bacteroidota bacterium]
MIQITDLQTSPVVPIKIDAHKLFTSGKTEVIHLKFKPGEFMEKHVNPMDVIFYIIEGNGTLEVENQVMDGVKERCIFIPGGIERRWINTGSGELKLLVIKVLT